MELSLEAAEKIIWGAWGLLSFIMLIVYLRWMGPWEDQKKDRGKRRARSWATFLMRDEGEKDRCAS